MAKSNKVIPKKRGRPATGRDPLVALRLPPSLVSAIETWAEGQNSSLSRSEAIRRLVEIGLASQPVIPINKKAATEVAGMAEKVIDRLGDDSAPPDVQAGRKRHLLKGPSEFREMRGKSPKPKG
jgi:hypothetical protein